MTSTYRQDRGMETEEHRDHGNIIAEEMILDARATAP